MASQIFVDPMRDLLRRADSLMRAGRWSEAVELYESAADALERGGFDLKSVAVSRQIVAIIAASAPELTVARVAALTRLERLYTRLGLSTEAEDVRRSLGEGQQQ
ncbi:hypothetical protein [Sorangium sp. So ce128]|uniref:hypothetical protein n=1 Tax=Sorangium sp. So ce128 TaxID=3133281 RepID=UPI003F63FBB2